MYLLIQIEPCGQIGHILHRFDCGADFVPSLGRKALFTNWEI